MEQIIQKQNSLFFDKKSSKFTLTVQEQRVQQNVCEFLLTSSFLVGQDVEEYLLNTDSRYDTVKIPLTMAGKSVTVGLADFISLKEAYQHQMYLLKLEDLLLHRGISISQ